MVKPGFRILGPLAVAAAAAWAAGCSLDFLGALRQVPAGEAGTRTAAVPLLTLAELGLEPADTVAVQTSGILGKNSSKFSGTVAAPQGILAKNSSKYRVQAYGEAPEAGAFVELNSPEFRVYSVDGKVAAGRTDAAGRYDLGAFGLPAGLDVLVVAWQEGSRRQILSYARSSAGDNLVHVDVASTYVTRYFLAQASAKGRALDSFDVQKLEAIRQKTKALLEREALVVEPVHLEKERRAELIAAYHAAMTATGADLLAAWSDLLGSDPVPPATPGPVQTETGSEERFEEF